MSPVPDPTAEPPAPGAEPTVGRDPADDATRTMDFVGAAGGSAAEYVPDVPGYEIIAEVGRGGMGVVYRAHDRNLGREVALKVLLGGAAAGPGAVIRFLAEAESLAALHHPNVVQVYDRGQYQGLPFFTMEFCPGGSLRDRVTDAAIPPREAAGLIERLARGVAAAHTRGILHRDLKPDNVLFAADGTPKITDFGLAKRLDDTTGMTQTGAVLGTPSYMAPEQAAGTTGLTTAADVYGLGAILYHLLTGGPPFRGATARETLIQVLEAEPAGPRARNPKVDRDLEAVCLKCLRKSPDDRYESAAALADDLVRWRAGEPTRARPLSVLERVTRWLRQNALAVTLVVGFGLVWGATSGVAFARMRLSGDPGRLRFWPTAPFHPMTWLAAARNNPTLGYTATTIALLQAVTVGWAIVRAARPKTPGLAYGYAAATGLIAGVVAFLFVGPLSATGYLEGLHDVRRRPFEEWEAAAADPGHRARRELDYLRNWLPPARQGLDYPNWQIDVAALADQAVAANELDRVYYGVWLSVLFALPIFLGVAVVSTWAAGLAGRRPGGALRIGLRYVEVFFPAVVAAVLLLVFVDYLIGLAIIGYSYPDRPTDLRDFPYEAGAVAFACALAGLAYLGQTRAWPWWQRAAAYTAWLAPFGVFVLAWLTRVK